MILTNFLEEDQEQPFQLLVMYGPARAKYPVATFSSPVGIGMFSTGIFLLKEVIAQIFLRLYIYEFLSNYFKT